jgi:pre-rRNA-processing protein TSR4
MHLSERYTTFVHPKIQIATTTGIDCRWIRLSLWMIQLGFCVPVTEDSPPLGHTSADWSQWDGGQVGGILSWLEPDHLPKAALYCQCDHADCPCYQNRLSSDKEENIQQLDTAVTTSAPSKSTSPKSRPTLLNYIGQLYAPEKEHRFHRTVYLFCCTRCSHVECHFRVRALRTQLPKINPYWPDAADSAASVLWTLNIPTTPLCVVCRFPAVGKCPVTQQRFCTREHQQRYFRHVHRKSRTEPLDGGAVDDIVERDGPEASSEPDAPFKGIYELTEIVVEEEPPLPHVVELDENPVDTLFPSTNDNDDSDDDDEQLEQADLNAITGGGTNQSLPNKGVDTVQQKKNQAIFTEFTRRITERPNCREQVLRYNCAWPDGASDAQDDDDEDDLEPLWMRDDHRPDTIPPCPLCGTARQFEFQLLPQFLQFLAPTHAVTSTATDATTTTTDAAVLEALRQTETVMAQTAPVHIPPALVEHQQRLVAGRRRQLLQQGNGDRPADWGVVVVYTCPNPTCHREDLLDHPLGAYCEEFVWVQPSIDAQWG